MPVDAHRVDLPRRIIDRVAQLPPAVVVAEEACLEHRVLGDAEIGTPAARVALTGDDVDVADADAVPDHADRGIAATFDLQRGLPRADHVQTGSERAVAPGPQPHPGPAAPADPQPAVEADAAAADDDPGLAARVALDQLVGPRRVEPDRGTAGGSCGHARRRAQQRRERDQDGDQTDSNAHHSCPPLDAPGLSQAGAGGRVRTVDLPLTRRLLCQLSYAGPPTSVPQQAGTRRATDSGILTSWRPCSRPATAARGGWRPSRPRPRWRGSSRRPRPPSAAAAPAVKARSGIMISRATGDVLWSKNPGLRLPPASCTKIMTALLVLEHYGDLGRYLRAPAGVKDQQTVAIGLRPGDRITVRQALRALLVKSANDADRHPRDRSGGQRAAFVRRMNRKAAAARADPHALRELAAARTRPGTTRPRATWPRWPPRVDAVRPLPRRRRHQDRGDHVAAVAPRDGDVPQPDPRLRVGGRHQDGRHGQEPARCSSARATPGGVPLIVVTMHEPTRDQEEKDAVALFKWGAAR